MNSSITFKNIDSSDALKDYVEKKLSKLDKFFDKYAEARVVFSVEKDNHIAEISVVSSKLNLKAKEKSDDMYSSIDLVMDKLKIQLSKFKEKVQSHRSKNRVKEEMLLEEPIYQI